MKKRELRLLALCLMAAMMMPLLVSCGADKANVTGKETDNIPDADDSSIAPSDDTLPDTEKTDADTNTSPDADTDLETDSQTVEKINETDSDTEPAKPHSLITLEGKNPIPDDGIYIIRDLSYGSRVNLLTKVAKASSQIFDLYLPDIPEKISPETPVFLYVHGGAWTDTNWVKDSDNTWLCHKLAESGMIAFSMNYALIGSGINVTVDDMISDIDAMLSHAKDLLAELGVKATSCGIGGCSAGGHLSSLYAYKYADSAPLKIAFEADIAGPTDLTSYKDVIDSYIKAAGSFAEFSKMKQGGLDFSTAFGGMVGQKEIIESNLAELWKKMETISPVNYVTKDSCPSILLYGLKEFSMGDVIPADVKSDGMVPYSCYERLEAKLKENGVPYTAKVFEGYGHGDLPWKAPSDSWLLEQILSYVNTYIG